MARASLTEQQQILLCAQFLAGRSYSAIAAEFGCHPNTVMNTLRRRGITAEMRAEFAAASPAAAGGDPLEGAMEDYELLGEPPTDPLAKATWMHNALGISATQILRDHTFAAEADRRKELRETALAMARVVPLDVMADVKKLIQQDRQELDKGGGPEMQDVPEGKPPRARRRAPSRKR